MTLGEFMFQRMQGAMAATKRDQRPENFLYGDGEGSGEKVSKGLREQDQGSQVLAGGMLGGEQQGRSPPGAIREKQGGKKASVTEAE